jgi:hypothetical protein
VSNRCAFWSAVGLSLALCLFGISAHLIGRLIWPASPDRAVSPPRGVLVLVNPELSGAVSAVPADPVALAAVRQDHDGAEAVQTRTGRCLHAAENGYAVVRVTYLLCDAHGFRKPFSVCYLLYDGKLIVAW